MMRHLQKPLAHEPEKNKRHCDAVIKDNGQYCFEGEGWKRTGLQTYELTTVFRQKKAHEVHILDKIRSALSFHQYSQLS